MNPRLPDLLVEEYQEQLDAWGVDDRDLLYAAESDPLDSYRAILALFNARNELFSQFGGSHVVLSPLGNKMLAVGAMLAALEQKIHVAMVESVGYEGVSLSNSELGITGLKHVWLCGDPYP